MALGTYNKYNPNAKPGYGDISHGPLWDPVSKKPTQYSLREMGSRDFNHTPVKLSPKKEQEIRRIMTERSYAETRRRLLNRKFQNRDRYLTQSITPKQLALMHLRNSRPIRLLAQRFFC